jgi:hypothetical protein
MAAVQVKSFVIDNTDTADAAIASGINVTSTVFDISVIPVSNTRSRVIIFYN